MATEYLIAGGTGLVGSQIILQLLQSADTGIIWTLGRRPVAAVDKRIQAVQYDFETPPAFEKKPDHPIAICTLGTTIKQAGSQEAFRRVDFDYVLKFAVLAQQNNARSFHVVTAHGASKSSLVFYNRVKGEIEEALRNVGLPEVHIYRPSLLIGERSEHRAGEGFATAAAKVFAPLFKLPGLSSVQPTPAAHLAGFILSMSRGQGSAVGYHIHTNSEIMTGS